MARQCCGAVFPDTRPAEWDVSTAEAPATGSYCRIDLTHNSAALDFTLVAPDDKPEAFGPFIRVTNSYNGLRALAFDIGLNRKVCRNGLIMPDSIIRFRYVHSARGLAEAIWFDVARDRLAKLTHGFGDLLRPLRECVLPAGTFEPLIRSVLELRRPENLALEGRDAEMQEKLEAHLRALEKRYRDELGNNAYAAFNAITDFASHPPASPLVRRDRHAMQRLAGAWLGRFSRECGEAGFEVGRYLEGYERFRPEA